MKTFRDWAKNKELTEMENPNLIQAKGGTYSLTPSASSGIEVDSVGRATTVTWAEVFAKIKESGLWDQFVQAVMGQAGMTQDRYKVRGGQMNDEMVARQLGARTNSPIGPKGFKAITSFMKQHGMQVSDQTGSGIYGKIGVDKDARTANQGIMDKIKAQYAQDDPAADLRAGPEPTQVTQPTRRPIRR